MTDLIDRVAKVVAENLEGHGNEDTDPRKVARAAVVEVREYLEKRISGWDTAFAIFEVLDDC